MGFGLWPGGPKSSFINRIYVNPKWQALGHKLLRRLERPLQSSRDKKSDHKIVIILWHTLRWKDIVKSRYSPPRWPSVLRHNAIISLPYIHNTYCYHCISLYTHKTIYTYLRHWRSGNKNIPITEYLETLWKLYGKYMETQKQPHSWEIFIIWFHRCVVLSNPCPQNYCTFFMTGLICKGNLLF